jgi:pre-mRNA-processing factor SLU7
MAKSTLPRSRYEEDVLINNHTAVWGSWWRAGQWGFACCHSMVKQSYCTGKAGIAAAEDLLRKAVENTEAKIAKEQAESKEEAAKAAAAAKLPASLTSGAGKKERAIFEKEAEVKLDEAKVKQAIEAQKKHVVAAAGEDDRRRPYNSMAGGYQELTPEEIEAYKRTRATREDPMRDFLGK